MTFIKTKSADIIAEAVGKLNSKFNDSFIYLYNGEKKAYYILHNLGERLFQEDVAKIVSDILFFDLYEKGYKNVFLKDNAEAVNNNIVTIDKRKQTPINFTIIGAKSFKVASTSYKIKNNGKMLKGA